MWISRGALKAISDLGDIVASLRDELSAERSMRIALATRLSELKIEHLRDVEEFRRRLAVAQANFEWLSVSHNKVSAEWQKLFNQRTQIDLPPLRVEFDRAPTQAEPEVLREAAERPLPRPDAPNSEELFSGVSFEDMGEEQARKQGVAGRTYDDVSSLMG